MPTRNGVYRFRSFELDPSRRRLLRDTEPVPLSDRLFDILLVLASNSGRVVSKDALIEAGWKDVAVGDNSIEQAISALRKTLGGPADGEPYIQTVARRGYRFAAPVERANLRESDDAIDALLAPYRSFVEGRAALETLDRAAVMRARDAFAQALEVQPDYSSAHIGMANACVLGFESTRADTAPDIDALVAADHHAREACRLDPSSGEAWSTLAFVLHRSGKTAEAIAAARKAISHDANDWRHYLRLASVSWGEERLRAANRVLNLCPGLALAHWFAATVFVARHAFDAAIDELRAGCAAQDAQRKDAGRFNAVGLHLLHGLVLAARGSLDEARDQFERELSFENDGQLYARECAANTWYAVGAIHLRSGHHEKASAAFEQALERVPGHALSTVALGRIPTVNQGPGVESVDVAIVKAAVLTVNGRHAEAGSLCGDALAEAEPGPVGWILPVEPLLNTAARREAWEQALAILGSRAA